MVTSVRQEAPPAGPLDLPEQTTPLSPQKIGVGAYTDIEAIYGPAQAEAGETVSIQVKVKNLAAYGIYIACTGRYNGNDFAFSPAYASVGAGQSYTFTFSFPMLDHDTRLDVWAFYWADTYWYEDDHEYVVIRLESAVGGWQLLDSTTVRVNSETPQAGWQLLDQATVTVRTSELPPAGWQLLDQVNIAVKAGAPVGTGWQLLDQTTVNIKAGPFPDFWELVEEQIYYWGYSYVGDAEYCTFDFSFPPDQIPGMDWLARTLVSTLASTLEDNDSRLLELRLWRDSRPVMWTDYKCEIIASSSSVGSRISLPWYAIVGIVCGVIVAVTFLIREIRKTWYEPHGLPHEVKAEWPRDHLINSIIYTAPETPPETLESMTDDELRDLLNRLLDEKKKGGWPWYQWLAVAGIAIGGSVAAVYGIKAYMSTRKERQEAE